jgi:hypothetical protein
LPGHDNRFYEVRYDGRLFLVRRDHYIKTLVGLGIPEEAIILDSHKRTDLAEQDAAPN